MAFCFQADFRFRDAQSAAFWQQICDLLACVEPKRRVGRLTRRKSQLKGESIMRKLAVAVALASTALASPALARDNSWYVGVGGGVMLVEDMDLDIGSIDNAGTAEHRKGYDFEGTDRKSVVEGKSVSVWGKISGSGD